VDCTCGPCTTRRRVLAWANGEVAERPSDVDIKFVLIRYAILSARHEDALKQATSRT
jgi:hypothetical protein